MSNATNGPGPLPSPRARIDGQAPAGSAEGDGFLEGHSDPQECYAAALAALAGMGPATLCRILDERTPAQAWAEVVSGVLRRPEPRRPQPGRGAGQMQLGGEAGAGLALAGVPSAPVTVPAGRARPWSELAEALDPPSWWERHRRDGIEVTWRGRQDYPVALLDDPQPPGVLFWRGDLGWLDRRRVAIVGTRSATRDGLAVAFEMGRDLVASGVSVVSGLALGIDGACHAGAIEGIGGPRCATAAPVGVVAGGVDVPYPRQHRELWRRVTQVGVIASESPPGRAPLAWMFPSRNRLIAGLAELVVVVESHRRGGSLITAEAAIDRGIEVRVVPGSVRSPASAGSNQLLCDGPGPVRDAGDVLDVLGLLGPRSATSGDVARSGAGRPDPGTPEPGIPAAGRAGPPAGAAAVLQCMGRRPVQLDQLMASSGLALAAVQRALEHLLAEGLVDEAGGWWTRR